jgi:phenylacetic acid degradation operon negative regulatory protein
MKPKKHAVTVLLERFHRQRPLRAGSLLVTLLGDAIAPRGGSISLASFIRLTRCFELPERLVRTSIARLAHSQLVSSARSGRNSVYSLTSMGRARFADATQRIYAATPPPWDGRWTVIVLPSHLKFSRDALRQQLGWLGFGQITPGVFVHPLRSTDSVRSQLDGLPVDQAVIFTKAKLSERAPGEVVTLGWNLVELSRRYEAFIAMFAALQGAALAASVPGGEQAFILRTLLLHEYRKIHLRDPLLPSALLPKHWAGADALALCRTIYSEVFDSSEQYLSRLGATLAGPLPPPSDEIYERFGGLPRRQRGI